MLDLNRYYYSIDLSKGKYFKLTNIFVSGNEEKNKINRLIYSIIEKYSSFFGSEHILLPIGFLPSNIIANYYLCRFDCQMQKIKSVIYYGRYVDDMLLVTKVTEEEALREKVQESGINQVAEYMLSELVESGILKAREEGNEYYIKGYKTLKIQKSKIRFFYMDKDGSDEQLYLPMPS